MLLIPAIELKSGKCVLPHSARAREVMAYTGDPVAVARQWVKAGARRLHVVDMDGAQSGKPANAAAIHAIVTACPGVPVQVSGGIRSDEMVASYFEAGVSYVVLGTKAVTAPHFVNDLCFEYPGHIIVGLDARDGRVAAEGWSKLANHDVLDAAEHFQREGAAAILYNDFGSNDNADGLHVKATLALAHAITIPVITAGEMASLLAVKKLCEAGGGVLEGAILGRALYEGRLDFAKAQELADSLSPRT